MSIPSLGDFTSSLDKYNCPKVKGTTLRKASHFNRIQCYLFKKHRLAREQEVLQLAINCLKEAPRVSPQDAFKGREVYILREWLGRLDHSKRFKKLSEEKQLSNPKFKLLREFKTELTAYRLGITSGNLNASVGLETFTEKKGYLPNYLSYYNHSLKTVSADSPVQIKMNGVYVNWSEAKTAIVDKEDAPGIKIEGLKKPVSFAWKYGREGLHNKDLFTTTLQDIEDRALISEKYRAKGKWLFSYCIFHSDNGPRFGGDHSWIRLINPDGKIYEFGKYRPPEIKGLTTLLVNHNEVFQSPDCSTMWPVAPKEKRQGDRPSLRHTDGSKRTKMHFEIDEAKFKASMTKIEKTLQKKDQSFGLFTDSCAVFANSIAGKCGIKLNTQASMIKLLLPAKLIPLIDRIVQYIPGILFKILYFVPGVTMNACCLIMGAARRSRVDGKRHIGSVRDFFNPYKSMLHHPWYVATQVKASLDKLRKKGDYSIPAQFQIEDKTTEIVISA